MDIEVEKILDNAYGEFKNRWPSKIGISDETILAIGKRYFELASGAEDTKDIVKKVKDIKYYCYRRSACDDCPLYVDTHDDGYRCIVKNGIPGNWEV